jgi:Mycothiol-dependent nitroreductase Rv2466c
MAADIHFHFDPVCPFAWITSRWVQEVVSQRDYEVDWRFISLRLLNKDIDYDAHFPPNYGEGHNSGLRLLRLAAKVRAEMGRSVIGDLYTAMGESIFDIERDEDTEARRQARGTAEHAAEVLAAAGLDVGLAEAVYDESLDAEIASDTEDALARTGHDVGTPIIHFEPPDGVAFFGPVISRVPRGEDATRLWDSVIELARFPGFAELKRSLREKPQLRSFGVDPDEPLVEEDWHQGSRRQDK